MNANKILYILISLTMFSCSKSTNVVVGEVAPLVLEIRTKGCKVELGINFNDQVDDEDGSCEFEGCLAFDENLKETYNKYKSEFEDALLINTCPEEVVEDFNQSNKAHVGILWVIDDSGSMRAEQENLANNFSSFINEFSKKSINFTMGITTTLYKPVQDAPLKLNQEKMNENKDQFISDFKKLINVGVINTSAPESGFTAANRYLESDSTKILKKNSHLVTIYVSDEEEQSKNLTIDEHIVELSNYVDSKNKVQSHSITLIKEENVKQRPESLGKRYQEISQKTKGITGSLREDFAPLLKNIGKSISDLIDTFKLRSTPYIPSIQVLVNGKVLDKGLWSYNEKTQSIVFKNAPAESSEIKIKYLPKS